jgi:hypothetical protein
MYEVTLVKVLFACSMTFEDDIRDLDQLMQRARKMTNVVPGTMHGAINDMNVALIHIVQT